MAVYEKLAISLRPEDTAFLDQVAAEKAVSRSAVIRWAVEHYRAFLLSADSTYRTNRHDDDKQQLDQPTINTT